MNVISHPAKRRRIIIREHYVAICEGLPGKGPFCAAAILDLFEIWTNGRTHDLQQKEETDRQLVASGKPKNWDDRLWIWKDAKELAWADLMGLMAGENEEGQRNRSLFGKNIFGILSP